MKLLTQTHQGLEADLAAAWKEAEQQQQQPATAAAGAAEAGACAGTASEGGASGPRSPRSAAYVQRLAALVEGTRPAIGALQAQLVEVTERFRWLGRYFCEDVGKVGGGLGGEGGCV